MNAILKLIIPIGLGLLAFAMNFLVMTEKPEAKYYAVVKVPLKQGEKFREAVLQPLPVDAPQVTKALPKSAVPWNERETLYDRETTRDLQKGDLVLWQDVAHSGWELNLKPGEHALPISTEGLSNVPKLIRPMDEIGFLVADYPVKPTGAAKMTAAQEKGDVIYVGPFRVLGVGDRVNRDIMEKKIEGRLGDERVITVAVRIDRESKEIKDQRVKDLYSGKGLDVRRRIVGIVLSPAHKREP